METQKDLQEIKDRLYNEIARRYNNLDDMAKRLQNEDVDGGVMFISTEQDRLDICAILDTFDGYFLED